MVRSLNSAPLHPPNEGKRPALLSELLLLWSFVVTFVELAWTSRVESKLARGEKGNRWRQERRVEPEEKGDWWRREREEALRVRVNTVGVCGPCDLEDGHGCSRCRINGVESSRTLS